jgi:cytochrome bd-type quinol oxidase subunit 2
MARGSEWKSFLAAGCYLAGMLLSAVFGIFPMLLPARNAAYSLTIESTQAGKYGLTIGLVWWILGVILVTGYFIFVYRSSAGKVPVQKHVDD